VRVLIAPDKFKGSLTAAEVAASVARGLQVVRSDVEVAVRPVADGGDGTVDAAVSVGFERIRVDAVGPTGEPVDASYGLRGGVAVVELADVVGLDRLPEGKLQPFASTTYGLGVVIRDALDRGVSEVVIGLGGSASTDGGAGMMQALGVRVLDAAGGEVAHGGGALAGVVEVDDSALGELVGSTRFVVASDVDNPLLGPRGAAAVFGPQKGAGPEDVPRLDAALATWAEAVARRTGTDVSGQAGTGAAGGTAFAAVALLGAELRPGIELMLDLVGFHDALPGVDLVITGEGSLDEQSLAGKAPMGVSQATRPTGAPVVAVCGRCLLSKERLAEAGISAAYPLSEIEPDVDVSMAEAGRLLVQVGERIAAEWLS
jgi:glycerate kinase